MPLPKYDDWMKETALGWNKPRSSELKGIDAALKAYEAHPGHATQKALRQAVGKWIRSKGNDWKKSERNKPPRFIVEELRTNAFSGYPVPMTKAEIEGLRVIENHRRQSLRTLFAGKKVTLKKMSASKEAAGAFNELKAAASSLRSSRSTASSSGGSAVPEAVKEMFSGLFDGATLSAIVPVQMEVFGQEIVQSVIPIVSHFASGAKVAWEWAKVAKAKHARYRTGKHQGALGVGDPLVAFRALDRLLQREISAQAARAGIQTADFSARSLLALADGGTVSGPLAGVATALAKLTQRLFLVGREYSESKAANDLLARPDRLNFRLFEAMPLMGCYMLQCSTLSDILNMSVIQFGNSGWMDDVQSAKAVHIDPLRERCKKFMDQSIYEINGIQFRPLV